MSNTKIEMHNLRRNIIGSFAAVAMCLTIFAGSVAAQVNIINNSSVAAGSAVSTQRHIVKTSEGTLHSFIQTGTQAAVCGGVSQLGILWFTSPDGGVTWNCGGQLSSDTVNVMYPSATVDSADNIYVVYSVTGAGGAPYNVYYRMLTKGTGSTWTLGTQQTVLSAPLYLGFTGGYSYATIEVQGTTRLWIATRYFDGANYMIKVLYSNGLSAAPTWTQSTGALDFPANNASYHIPTLVRFKDNIGVIYNDQILAAMRWRFRNDADSLTAWSTEAYVSNSIAAPTAATFSGVGDSNGNIYLAVNNGTANILFTYWNGSVWTNQSNVSTTGVANTYVSVATDGVNAWVFYPDTLGLAAGSKLVYKKGYYPFTASEFDIAPTPAAPYHTTFDKTWRYFSGAFTDVSGVAASSALGDVSMVTAVGDIMYFGKSAKFDSIA